MVDYNNDVTVTTPPMDVLKISILERRSLVINSIESYTKMYVRSQGSIEDYKHIISSLSALWYEIRAAYTAQNPDNTFERDLYNIMKSDIIEIEKLKKLFADLDDFLYSKKLTRFDSRTPTDMFNIEEVNEKAGN